MNKGIPFPVQRRMITFVLAAVAIFGLAKAQPAFQSTTKSQYAWIGPVGAPEKGVARSEIRMTEQVCSYFFMCFFAGVAGLAYRGFELRDDQKAAALAYLFSYPARIVVGVALIAPIVETLRITFVVPFAFSDPFAAAISFLFGYNPQLPNLKKLLEGDTQPK